MDSLLSPVNDKVLTTTGKGHVAKLGKLIRSTVVVALAAIGLSSSAFAGGEDFETFEAYCTGQDSNTGKYPVGTRCSASLRHGGCLGDAEGTPGGFDAVVVRKNGRSWKKVSAIVHYEPCYEESENGVNRRMNFKVTSTGTFAVLVDGVGDGQPPYFESVLGPTTLPSLTAFRVDIR